MSTPVTITTNTISEPPEEMDERLMLRSTEQPKQLLSRLQSAKQITSKVTPVAQGMYRIKTTDEEYVINLDSLDEQHNPQPACLCDDFIFRASNDGFDCKHVLLVKYLIHNEYLPPIDEEPVEWMKEQLFDYQDMLKEYKPTSSIADDHATWFKAKTKVKNALKNPYESDLREIEHVVTKTIEAMKQTEPQSEIHVSGLQKQEVTVDD